MDTGCEIAIVWVNPCIKEGRVVLEQEMDSSRNPPYTDSDYFLKCFSPQCPSSQKQPEPGCDTTPMTHSSWNITRQTLPLLRKDRPWDWAPHKLLGIWALVFPGTLRYTAHPLGMLWEQPQALQEGRRFREGCDPSYFKHKFSPFKQRSHFSVRQWGLNLMFA